MLISSSRTDAIGAYRSMGEQRGNECNGQDKKKNQRAFAVMNILISIHLYNEYTPLFYVN